MAIYDVSTTEKKATPSLVAGGTLYADNPLGTILPFGGSDIPSGWLLCNGAAVSRTTYSELFAVIGESFGAGDGSTTFNLPDMRESVPKGAGLTGNSSNHMDADGLALGEFIDDRTMSEFGIITTGSGSYNVNNSTGGGTYYKVSSNRHGATTEVKSVGVNYIIKAKMVGVPIDFLAKAVENNEYSTTETVVGKWIDGKPIYRKVCVVPSEFHTNGPSWVSTGVNKPSNIDKMTSASLIVRTDGKSYNLDFDCVSSTDIKVSTLYTSSLYIPANSYFIIEYTKTTD